ncbi:MAG: helix-turn-helix transcriptional regulator [Caldilineaceae bacterium]
MGYPKRHPRRPFVNDFGALLAKRIRVTETPAQRQALQEFGLYMRTARRHHQLSQALLARQIGEAEMTVYALEHGLLPCTQIDQALLERLATALHEDATLLALLLGRPLVDKSHGCRTTDAAHCPSEYPPVPMSHPEVALPWPNRWRCISGWRRGVNFWGGTGRDETQGRQIISFTGRYLHHSWPLAAKLWAWLAQLRHNAATVADKITANLADRVLPGRLTIQPARVLAIIVVGLCAVLWAGGATVDAPPAHSTAQRTLAELSVQTNGVMTAPSVALLPLAHETEAQEKAVQAQAVHIEAVGNYEIIYAGYQPVIPPGSAGYLAVDAQHVALIRYVRPSQQEYIPLCITRPSPQAYLCPI